MYIGLRQSVWFDEAFSIMIAKKPLSELIRLTSVDTHPPLYYLILKSWAGLFGWGEFALRSLSALAAAGVVIFSGLLVKRAFGNRTALVSLPFIVFAPFLLRYGFEIRMYAIVSLIGIVATYVLVLAMETRSGRRQWLLYSIYAILVALGVYMLYYSVLLWFAHLIWLTYVAHKNKQPIIKSKWMIAYIGSVILFLPWLPTFLRQITNGALAPISQALTIDNLVGIVSFSTVYQPTWQLSPIISLVVLFAIISIVYFSIQAFKHISRKQKPYLMLLAFYVLVPISIIAVVSIFRPMYVERYISHIIIGGYIFLGVVVALSTYNKSSMIEWAVAGLLFATLLFGTIQLSQTGNFNFQRLQKPTVNDVAGSIPRCDDDSIVLAAGPYEAIELSYYLPNCQLHFYSKTAELSGGYAALSNSRLRTANPTTQFINTKRLAYVYYGQPELEMPLSFKKIDEKTFGSMHVATFVDN